MTTDKISVVAQAIYNRIKDNKNSLEVNEILYGDHIQINVDKAVVVTPRMRRRIWDGIAGPGGRTRNEFDIEVNVYVSRVGDEATQRLAVEQLAERVESILYTDITLGGVVIHGAVMLFDEGNVRFQQGNSNFRAVRMLYTGISKTNVGP